MIFNPSQIHYSNSKEEKDSILYKKALRYGALREAAIQDSI